METSPPKLKAGSPDIRDQARLKEAERQCDAQWDDPAFARLSLRQAIPFVPWAMNQKLRETNKEFVPRDVAYESWDDMMRDLANYVYEQLVAVLHSHGGNNINAALWNLDWVCKRIDDSAASGRSPWEALLIPFRERSLRQGEPRGFLPSALSEAMEAIPGWEENDPVQSEEAGLVHTLEKNLGEKLAKAGLVFTLTPGSQSAWNRLLGQFADFVQPHLRDPACAEALRETVYELYFRASISKHGGPQPYARMADINETFYDACAAAPDPGQLSVPEGMTRSNVNNFMALAALSPTFANYISKRAAEEDESIRQGAMGY